MDTATTIIKTYRDWTIAKDEDRVGELICYPTEHGISHDYDYDGDRTTYCGNCLWFNDLAEAEDGIDDRIIEMQEKEIEMLRRSLQMSNATLRGIKSALSKIITFELIDQQLAENEHALNYKS